MCSASPRLAGTFDLLVYTDAASNVPTEWEDSDPRFIQNAADVKLRSFTTKVRMPYPLNAGCLMILFAAALRSLIAYALSQSSLCICTVLSPTSDNDALLPNSS